MAERNETQGNEGDVAGTPVTSASTDNTTEASNGTQNGQAANSAGGSIFASPKLSLSSSNPFAVRSPPSSSRNASSENSENHPNPPIIAPSRFGASAAVSSSSSSAASAASTSSSIEDAECNGSTSSRPLLRPSLIGSGAGGVSTPSNHNSILKPASLGNPFAKAADVSDESPVSNHRSGEADAKPTPSGFLMPSRLNHVAKHPDSSSAPPAAGEEGGCSSPQPAESTPAAGTSLAALAKPTMPSVATNSNPFSVASASIGFVFGQKLHERVTNHSSDSVTHSSNGIFPSSSDNLFTVIAKQEKGEADSSGAGGGGGGGGGASAALGGPASNGLSAASKTLTDSARELEEARAAKRKYDEVAVVTGEEDELNVLQIYGKLFTFDKVQGTWIERGRGTLRLNDKQLENQTLQSRLVMRTQGSLRVILNTKIWADMTVDKASTKSVRLTAMDGDQIRVFLLMASLKDTETLFNALEWRLATVRTQQSRANSSGTNLPSSPGIAAAAAACPEDVDSELSASSPKRRSLSVSSPSAPAAASDPDEPDEAKKKRSE